MEIMLNMDKISVKAIIVWKNNVLLLKPRNLKGSIGGWDVPGGHVKTQETLTQALVREVYEETGIKIQKAYPIKILKLSNTSVEYVIFLCKTISNKVVLSDEHTDYRWVQIENVDKTVKRLLFKDLLEIKNLISKLLI